MKVRYHLRILALGVPATALLIATIYGMTFLPLWTVEIPLLLCISYFCGRLIELSIKS